MTKKVRKAPKKTINKSNDSVETSISNENIKSEIDKTIQSDNVDDIVNNVKSLILLACNDPNVAKAMGFQTGLNTSVIVNEISRIREGTASRQEVLNLIDNLWNIFRGYFIGNKAFSEIIDSLDKSIKIARKNIVEEIKNKYDSRDN